MKILTLILSMVQLAHSRSFNDTYMRVDDSYLGQGAQGAVFRVVRRDDPQGKTYAAKTYHANYTAVNEGNHETLFNRELTAYRALPDDSPYIGKLVDSFNEESTKVLILELINGTSLHSHLQKVKESMNAT